MRIDLDLPRRTTIAESQRRRAAWLRARATERTMSEARLEMEAEAGILEAFADALMDYDAPSEKSPSTLIEPTKDIDIIAPVPNGKAPS